MALIHLDFESEFMGSNQDVNIIVPDKPRDQTPSQFYSSSKKYKVLWLLHGTFGGYSDWLRKSNIELYACEKNLIVVMPGIGNADYENWSNFTIGLDADRYIIDELMPLVYNWLPASDKKEDNFVAGLSMGGAGALHFALKYPSLFDKAAILSYVPWETDSRKDELEKLFALKRKDLEQLDDVMHMQLREYNRMHRYDSVQEYLDSESNLYRLLMQEAGNNNHPSLFFACGTEDVLMADNFRKMKKIFKDKNWKAEWSEGPGNHEWRVWERDIQKALLFFDPDQSVSGNAF